jgi:hypothetical protein
MVLLPPSLPALARIVPRAVFTILYNCGTISSLFQDKGLGDGLDAAHEETEAALDLGPPAGI